MKTSRPERTRLSRVRALMGLTAVIVLALSPALHHHPPEPSSPVSGQPGIQCTLCAVFQGMEPPGLGSASTHQPALDEAPVGEPISLVALAPRGILATRAPPRHA
jgi:hypothetical protein